MLHTPRTSALAVAALSLLLASCSLAGEDAGDDRETVKRGESLEGTSVVLLTHDSFALPDPLVKGFEKRTGIDLKIRPSGDAGALTTALSLNVDNPQGDLAFGVDNTFASRAIQEGVFAEYDAPLPPGAEKLTLDGGENRLAPVDQASVCVNVDTAWFEKENREPPRTLDELADPAWKDLLVLPGATTSSPGLAFLLATIAEYGEDGWQDYWQRLLDNGVKITKGWTEAYSGSFTAGGEGGTRPIVVSYDTSPAFTVEDGHTTTAALLDTCFRQVEYAGVLENAKNPAGAEKVVDFLLSEKVQAALPQSMYVFPVDETVELPKDWAAYAEQPTDPYQVSAEDIEQHRQEWLTEWSDIVSR